MCEKSLEITFSIYSCDIIKRLWVFWYSNIT